MNNVITYPRIDHQRGLAVRVERHPGEKICAHISLRHTADRLFADRPPAPVTPLRGFLIEAHLTACLTACLTVIVDRIEARAARQGRRDCGFHDRLLGLPAIDIHRAMVTARRILEGGGTVRAAVHWALKPHEDYDLRNPPC